MEIDRKCPFCGEIDDLVEIWFTETCHVCCHNCECLGPAGSSWEEAIKKWDERSGDAIK